MWRYPEEEYLDDCCGDRIDGIIESLSVLWKQYLVIQILVVLSISQEWMLQSFCSRYTLLWMQLHTQIKEFKCQCILLVWFCLHIGVGPMYDLEKRHWLVTDSWKCRIEGAV